MAFAQVHPGDLIQSQNLNQIVNALNGTSGDGQPVLLVALNDPNNYALTVQNLDPTNCRGLLVLKNDGTTLLSAGCNGVTLGSPLTLPTDLQIPNANLGPDVARANVLVNPGLEVWQRGAGPFTGTVNAYCADRWFSSVSGTDTVSVSQNTPNADSPSSSSCAAITYTRGTGPGLQFLQAINQNDTWALHNRPVALSIRVKTTTANAIRPAISPDGGNTWTYGNYHSGSGNYETLTVTLTVTGNAFVGLYITASCTAYVDNASLVAGSQPANYVPLHPADDLARCKRYYQRWDSASNASMMYVGGMVYGANVFYVSVPTQAEMAVTPTITNSGPTGFQAYCAGAGNLVQSLGTYTADRRVFTMNGSTSAGLTKGYAMNLAANNNTATWFAAESNP